MNANTQRLSEQHEDERSRHTARLKIAGLERQVRDLEARLAGLGERSGCEVRSDDTGFTPGVRGIL